MVTKTALISFGHPETNAGEGSALSQQIRPPVSQGALASLKEDIPNPFQSTLLSKFYFAPFRPSYLKEAIPLKSAGKWALNQFKGNSHNPLKSAIAIQQLSPIYHDANELSVEQCENYVKQSYICRASMNRQATYSRSRESLAATYLSGITTLHGGYDLHAGDSPTNRQKMAETSLAAKEFLQKTFPKDICSVILNGKGSFNDKNTGLCATFLFEHPQGASKPTIHVVFPGTGAGENALSHVAADLAVLTRSSHVPPSFAQGRNIVQMMKDCAEDKANIEVKGFSLGGAIAAYSGLCSEVNTITLCPLGLPPSVWKILVNEKGDDLARIVQEKLVNLTIEGDLAAGHGTVNNAARKLESAVALKMPHILGKTFVISTSDLPENYKKPLIGYGIHTSSNRLWAAFYEKKKAAEGKKGKAPARIGGLEGEPNSSMSASSYQRDPAAAEYTFLLSLDKLATNTGLNQALRYGASNESRKLASQVKRLRSSYGQLSPREKLKALTDLEVKLLKARTGNLLDAARPANRKLYAAVVEERNRLLSPPRNGWAIGSFDIDVTPHQSNALIDGIGAVTKGAQSTSTIHTDSVVTRKNAILPMTLRTADEIAPAAYALIRNAERNVKLQTYLFYEKSESAKWLHKALDELQQKQREKKAAGLDVTPIDIEILLDDSRGLAKQDLPGDGGRFQSASVLKGKKEIARKNDVSNYGIGYPAKLDPALVSVTVKGLKHFGRGSLHSKTLLVDEKYSLVSTNNFKGTHHKISMDGQARFDAGLIFSGAASKAILDDLVTVSEKTGENTIGSNAHEAAIGEENKELYSLPREHQPAVHSGEVKPWGWKGYDIENEAGHASDIVASVEHFLRVDPSENDLKMVVISKPPDNSFYSGTPNSPQRAAYLHAFSNARSYIRITNVNLNVPEVIDALVAAAERNIRVEVVLPDDTMEVLSAMDAKTNCQAFYELQTRIDSLGKGEFLDLRWQASSSGKLPDKGAQSHAKYMNVDGVAFLGSTNLDIQSWKYSAELSVATADPDTVSHLDQACFVGLFQHGIPFKPLANDDPGLMTEDLSWAHRSFTSHIGDALPLPTKLYAAGNSGSRNNEFLDAIASGHPFKWASIPSYPGASDVDIGIKFNSRQQGYKQIKHTLIHPDQGIASAGMAVLTDNANGTKSLIINNESGHFQPDINSIADETTATNSKWKDIASDLQANLEKPVQLEVRTFSGLPTDSLEIFRGQISEDLLQRRLRFLEEARPHLDEKFSNKLLRGEVLFFLENIQAALATAHAEGATSPTLGINSLESLQRLVGQLGDAIEAIDTKKSRLKFGTRKIADRVQGVMRKSPGDSKGRHYDRVVHLQEKVVALKANLADQPGLEVGAGAALGELVESLPEVSSNDDINQIARALTRLQYPGALGGNDRDAPQVTTQKKKSGRAPGHAGAIIPINDQYIAKLTSVREAEAYREFSTALEGAVCGYRSVSDFPQEDLDAEKQAALSRLVDSQPEKTVIILDRVGANIKPESKRELDIKLGKTVSYTQMTQDGRSGALVKLVKQAALGKVTGTQSLIGQSRHYRVVGANQHGEQLGKGRMMIGYRTAQYVTGALDLPRQYKEANLAKIVNDLTLIRRRLADAPVAFIGSSVLIAIDEQNPANTEVKLIDLAHPVLKNDPSEQVDYAEVARHFDVGIANLIKSVTAGGALSNT